MATLQALLFCIGFSHYQLFNWLLHRQMLKKLGSLTKAQRLTCITLGQLFRPEHLWKARFLLKDWMLPTVYGSEYRFVSFIFPPGSGSHAGRTDYKWGDSTGTLACLLALLSKRGIRILASGYFIRLYCGSSNLLLDLQESCWQRRTQD